MAIQSQGSNQLVEVGDILRRHVWQILVPACFVLSIGYAGAQLWPKQYAVQTVIVLRESTSPGTGTTIQRDVNAAKTEIKANDLVREVIKSQEWSDFAGLSAAEQNEYVVRVAANINPTITGLTKNATGSSFITVKYSDADGQRAERFLNTLRDRYIASVVGRVIKAARDTRDKLQEVRGTKEREYKETVKRRAELAKLHKLSVTQPAPGGGRQRGEDPMYERLTQARNQLGANELELKSERASLEVSRKMLEVEPPYLTESVAAATTQDNADAIKQLDKDIDDKRTAQKPYRPPSQYYKKYDKEIRELEEKRAKLKGEVIEAPTVPQKFTPNQRRIDLQQQIQAAEVKIAGLETVGKSLAVEVGELESTQRELSDVYRELQFLSDDEGRAMSAYSEADMAYTQAKDRVEMLNRPEANPFEVVEVAVASPKPSSPNVPLIVILAGVLGLVIGVASAFGSEFLRNGYRSVNDITRSMSVPVLGSVNVIVTRAESRRVLVRRLMVGASSLVIIGAILWVTWAYQNKPRLLGPSLTQLIDNMREAVRP